MTLAAEPPLDRGEHGARASRGFVPWSLYYACENATQAKTERNVALRCTLTWENVEKSTALQVSTCWSVPTRPSLHDTTLTPHPHHTTPHDMFIDKHTHDAILSQASTTTLLPSILLLKPHPPSPLLSVAAWLQQCRSLLTRKRALAQVY
jgi:hypothetical protein